MFKRVVIMLSRKSEPTPSLVSGPIFSLLTGGVCSATRSGNLQPAAVIEIANFDWGFLDTPKSRCYGQGVCDSTKLAIGENCV